MKVNSGREEDRSTLDEPEPKRVKPDNGGTGMELDSLRKIVTVKSWTQVVAGPTPEEEPQPSFWAWDDVSGETLDPTEVRQARQVEMDYVYSRKVWRRVPRALAVRNGWKVIPTRWIDTNKGDSVNPNYRSRLVAKEFNTGTQEGLFAATPPLEALRLLISRAATRRAGAKSSSIMLNDVARAFFEAPMTRTVCVC